MMLKVLDVDGAVRRVSGGWAATGRDWAYDTDRYARVAAERSREQQAMLGYIATRGCRMEYLRRELDDPAAAPCGRCDNCTGQPWPDAVQEADAAAAGERLLRPGVQITPRRMWPTGMKDLGIAVSGKIAPELSAEPGRALGRLTDLGWGPRLRALLSATRSADDQVPDDIIDAVVKVLAAWDWAARPVGVVALPSRTRPQLISNLSRRIAEIGRLPYLGTLAFAHDSGADGGGFGSSGAAASNSASASSLATSEPSQPESGGPGASEPGGPGASEPGGPGASQPGGPVASEPGGPAAQGATAQSAPHQNNSAQRLRALWDELTAPEALRDAVAQTGGPVLLVDDRVETGWTMTVAAKVLREAGAAAVLPFALAVTAGA